MHVRPIAIPEECKLTRVSRATEDEALKEKEELKRHIMHYHYDQMSSSSNTPSGPRTWTPFRPGKGGHKGGYFGYDPRQRKHEYVGDEFLPETDHPDPYPRARIAMSNRNNRGGSGGVPGVSGGANSGGHMTFGNSRGRAQPASGISGPTDFGGRRRTDNRGTPCHSTNQGAF